VRDVVNVQRVVHRADPRQPQVEPPLGVGDGYQAHAPVDVTEYGPVLPDRIAVHGGDGGHRPPPGQQGTDRGVVVNDVELLRTNELIHLNEVGQFGQCLADPLELQLGVGRDETGGGVGPLTRPEQGHRVAPGDQPVHQAGDHVLQAAVAGRRHRQPRRDHHRDP